MAIVDVKTSWSGDKANSHTDGSTGGRGAQAVQTVLIDDTNDTALTIEASSLVFQLGDPHPGDQFRKCTSQNIDRTSLLLFTVTARFGIAGLDVSGAPAGSPLDVRPDKRWTHVTTDEPIDEDVNGDAIANVNGELFDPPVSEEHSDLVLIYVRNLAVYDALFFDSFSNRTNSTTFMGWPAGQVLCKPVVAENIIEKGFEYWRVTGEFHFRGQGKMSAASKAWWKRVRHEGFYERLGGKRVRAKDGHGQFLVTPLLLKISDGARVGDPDAFGYAALAEWLEVQTKLTADLNSMGLIL